MKAIENPTLDFFCQASTINCDAHAVCVEIKMENGQCRSLFNGHVYIQQRSRTNKGPLSDMVLVMKHCLEHETTDTRCPVAVTGTRVPRDRSVIDPRQ